MSMLSSGAERELRSIGFHGYQRTLGFPVCKCKSQSLQLIASRAQGCWSVCHQGRWADDIGVTHAGAGQCEFVSLGLELRSQTALLGGMHTCGALAASLLCKCGISASCIMARYETCFDLLSGPAFRPPYSCASAGLEDACQWTMRFDAY